MAPQLSIVVPAYNEELCLELFFNQLRDALAGAVLSYEVIFVDDGSRDTTSKIISRLNEQYPEAGGIVFSKNFGKEAAIHAGLAAASGAAAIVIDADGQHPVSLIPQMVRCWQEQGAMIVNAVKMHRSCSYWATLRANLFYSFFKRIAKIDLKDESDYKLLDRRAIDILLAMPERVRFFRGLTKWIGLSQVNLQFDVSERLAGTTKWSMLGLAAYALNAIVAFSSAPLIVIVYLGFLGVICSSFFAVIAVLLKYSGTAMTGWTSLIIIISFFSSMILTSIGFLGLYIMKIYDEVKGRQHYIVAHKITPAVVARETKGC